jgi:TolB-like protein
LAGIFFSQIVPVDNSRKPESMDEQAGRLESWKEIAAFLGRQVRTINLWEKREGLPIHRHLHLKRGTVFALKSELKDWLRQRTAEQPANRAKIHLSKPHSDRSMILVLPFENLSGDPSRAYFSDGLTEEMISQLGRVRPEQLGVIARTSSMHYKGTKKSVAAIGRELNVDYVLEGSVRLSGDRARITAQLIQVTDQSNVWSQSYERNLSDILLLQTEVASDIAKRVVVELAPAPPDVIPAVPPKIGSEAYEAYLRGRQYCSQRTEEGLLKAVHYFCRAIAIDPKLAVAHSGLADAYYWLSEYGSLPPRETVPLAKAAAMRALEVNPELGESHATLCNIKMFYDWDWESAHKEYDLAIKLNPSYAIGQTFYASCLSAMGRHEEACAAIELARKFDPHSQIISVWEGLVLRLAGQYKAAASVCAHAVKTYPDFALGHWALGLALEQMDRREESLAAFEEADRLSREKPGMLSGLGHAQATCGKRNRSRQTLERLLALSAKRYVPAYDIAMVYLGLGNNEEAVRFIEMACEERSAWFISLPHEPRAARLRSNPRFKRLMAKLGAAFGNHKGQRN